MNKINELYGKDVIYGHLLIALFQFIMALVLGSRNIFVACVLLVGTTVSIWLSIYTATHDLKIRTHWYARGRVKQNEL